MSAEVVDSGLRSSDALVEVDKTIEGSFGEGERPPLWEVQFKAKLTILVALAGLATLVDLGFVLAEGKVKPGSIFRESGVYGAPGTSRAEILRVLDKDLAPIWMI